MIAKVILKDTEPPSSEIQHQIFHTQSQTENLGLSAEESAPAPSQSHNSQLTSEKHQNTLRMLFLLTLYFLENLCLKRVRI